MPTWTLLIACAASALPAAGAQAFVATGPPQQSLDTVRAAVHADWPPHYVVRDGAPSGFAVDIMNEVAARTGLSVRYEVFPNFAAMTDALRDGRVDVIPDFGITDARSSEFSFTRPFEAFRISAFARATDGTIASTRDLPGMRVGVVTTNAAIELLRREQPRAQLVEYEGVREALFGLLAANVDAVAYPEEVFLAVARSADLQDRIRVVPDPLIEVSRAMATRASDSILAARLTEGLDSLLESPEFGRIYQRWLTTRSPSWNLVRILLWALATLLVALLGMGAWRYHSVSRAARELKRTLDERDAAEAGRRREEERFRTLVETAFDAIAVSDASSRITFVNRRFCELVGRPEREIVGRGVVELIAEDDRERVRQGMADRRAGLAESYEIRFVRPDDSVAWAIVSVAPLYDENGDFQGTVGTATDISARIRAERALEARERRFRALVENSTDLISMLGADGRMGYQSPPVTPMLGYRPDELEGRNVFELIHPDDLEAVQQVWREALAHPNRSLRTDPFRFQHRTGSWRTLITTLTNLLDDPAVGAILSNAHDITEQLELESRLRQSQKLEAVGRLAGGIAHDFNNLLTVIRAQTDFLLLQFDLPSEAAEEVKIIQSSGDRAAELTAQLLAFSREQVLRPRSVDLNDVVRDFVALIRRVIGEDVSIDTHLAADLPNIEVDRGQLEQALMNLGINARDAMPDGGRLSLSTRLGAEGGDAEPGAGREADAVVLEVSDTGVGMDEECLSKIFEPFFTTKPTGRGTGLGLAMVYGFVAQSGGDIEARSQPGRGTTFRITFPQEQSDARQPEDHRTVGSSPRGNEIEGIILVVEDNPAVRRVVERILDRDGYAVEAVGDAELGIEVLKRRSDVALILTDLALPGMSGTELAERVRSDWPGLPLVVMSGYAESPAGLPLELDPDLPFIQKPLVPETLLQTIRDTLERARGRRRG